MPTTDDRARRGAWGRWIVAAIALLAIGAGVGWAATVVFAPPRDVIAETPYTFVELVDGEVGSSLTLNTVAEWTSVPVGTNQAAGTVTAVRIEPGTEVAAGTVLYEVNLRPVIAAFGATPAFRALSRGTTGADVQQLQTFLAQLGIYGGEQDGEFGWQTEQAVRDWQESMDLEDDGVVQAGDILFLPTLPGRVALDPEQVFRGATLSGGEAVVSGLSPEPTFTVPVAAAQAASIPVGTQVRIQADGAEWVAEISGQQPSEDGDQVELLLQGVGGASICVAACTSVPANGQSIWPSEIVTQQLVAGVVAPSAALLSDPDGRVTVVDADGESHEVSVVASARGMSVIEGVQAGLRVQVPASGEATE